MSTRLHLYKRCSGAFLLFLVCCGCATAPPKQIRKTFAMPESGVFVLGGIHQTHEKAEYFTYRRVGEVFEALRPDVLCVETAQKYVDDGSFSYTPFDFSRHMIPAAKARKIPIYGIDPEAKGGADKQKWLALQAKVARDPRARAAAQLVGSMFRLLNDYFKTATFEEVNADTITAVWRAKNSLKYSLVSKFLEYAFVAEYEERRNNLMVKGILDALAKHPGSKVLVGVGIDHKYYIEDALRKKGIRVFTVEELIIP